jgi:hypothetical protein
MKQGVNKALFFSPPLFHFLRGQRVHGLPVTPPDASDETGVHARR